MHAWPHVAAQLKAFHYTSHKTQSISWNVNNTNHHPTEVEQQPDTSVSFH